jgi:hypothetical protein
MFRTTCDKRVTTSAARQPTNSKPEHLEMPAGKSPMCTKPNRSNRVPCPTSARQRLIATPITAPPSIGIPNPGGTGRVLALRQLGASRSVAPHTNHRP